MNEWTADQLATLFSAPSLHLAAGDDARSEVELGMVTVRAGLYVRAFRGSESAWFRAAVEHRHGRIRWAEFLHDVSFHTIEPAISDEIDAAYLAKYPALAGLVLSPIARSATLEIAPA